MRNGFHAHAKRDLFYMHNCITSSQLSLTLCPPPEFSVLFQSIVDIDSYDKEIHCVVNLKLISGSVLTKISDDFLLKKSSSFIFKMKDELIIKSQMINIFMASLQIYSDYHQ